MILEPSPRIFFRIGVVLASSCSLGECAMSNPNDRSSAQSQEQDLESVSDLAPSAIHWTIAIILGLALVGGLVRVVRILAKDDSIVPMRHAPEGMRPVQCGGCSAMQHVTLHGRIFICFSCRSANRIAMDPTSIDEPVLVASTGPLRRFDFHREGENFFATVGQVEIDDAEARECLARTPCSAAGVPPPSAEMASTPRHDDANKTSTEVSTDDLESGTRPSPQIIGNNMDSELISNASKKSRITEMGGLPTCVVCLEEPGNMVLLPCAHGGVCDGCTTRIAQNRASGGAHCPHCRSVIETLVKIHEVDGDKCKGVEFRIPIARVP